MWGREGVSSCGCVLGVYIFVAVGLEEIKETTQSESVFYQCILYPFDPL